MSVLGGPRIGAPLIPLPGGGGPEAVAPVAGPLVAGQPGQALPSVPLGQTVSPGAAEQPCQPGPDHACRASKPSMAGPTVVPTVGSPTGGSPEEPGATAGPTDVGPTGGTREPVEPTPGVAERSLPSMPSATKLPPRPPVTSKPPGTPGQPPVTPSGPPAPPKPNPKPTTIAEALKALLETLRP
ncbi:hypothetical protein [Kribbella sp. NPDC051620]|uniref:hypothetical protein n=1 Tax=Kribbella sp. NPDC051620 TaxID=3364120 RepID=UPI0037A5EA12